VNYTIDTKSYVTLPIRMLINFEWLIT